MNDERRTFTGGLEIRDGHVAGQRMAVGYAAKFDTRSENLGGFVERVAPSAFTKTVQEADVVALRDHEPSRLLGRTSAGTLRLGVDEIGLRYEIDLPDTSEGRDTRELLERGDLLGSSFGFRTIADSWSETSDGYPLRTLHEVALRDVGPVTFPAYSSSEVALRHLADNNNFDLRTLVDAAERDELRSLILPRDDDDGQAAEEAPVVSVHRPRVF